MRIPLNDTDHLSDIYRMIFSLSSLKYNKLTLDLPIDDFEDIGIIMSMTINKQVSTIQRLVIDYGCTYNMLLSILQHIPQLRYLICQSLTESDIDINIKQPIVLFNLISIFIIYPPSTLNDFEIFIMKLSTQIQVLIIENFFDETFLNADQWKQLILKYMPRLRSFHLGCDSYLTNDLENTPVNALISPFLSPFWIERQLFPEFAIENRFNSCSIYQYRYRSKGIFSFQKDMD